MQLVGELLGSETYTLGRYSEAKLVDEKDVRARWKFQGKAVPAGEELDVEGQCRDAEVSKTRSRVMIDSVAQKHESRDNLIGLLEEHIQQNVIQILSLIHI